MLIFQWIKPFSGTKITWKLIRILCSYNQNSKRCLLCLNEKCKIGTYKGDNLLNERTEIINTCRQRRNYNFANCDTIDWRRIHTMIHILPEDCRFLRWFCVNVYYIYKKQEKIKIMLDEELKHRICFCFCSLNTQFKTFFVLVASIPYHISCAMVTLKALWNWIRIKKKKKLIKKNKYANVNSWFSIWAVVIKIEKNSALESFK